MIDGIDIFASTVDGLSNRSKTEQIDLFAYYLSDSCDRKYFSAADIRKCFGELCLPEHSNISSYLSAASKRGKIQKYIKSKDGYLLTLSQRNKMNEIFCKVVPPKPSDNLFPKDILEGCRSYIIDISNQAIACFDKGLYDACSIMLRKLIEVLIIEAFERYSISGKVKNDRGDFFYLSDLITCLLNEKKWNIGRNAKDGFSKIKKIGDMSAHNRRYFSKKPDIDDIRENIRICIQELIVLIDYPAWNQELKK
jgi:hypothetical protein